MTNFDKTELVDVASLETVLAGFRKSLDQIEGQLALLHEEHQRTAATVYRIKLLLDSDKSQRSTTMTRLQRLEDKVLTSDK